MTYEERPGEHKFFSLENAKAGNFVQEDRILEFDYFNENADKEAKFRGFTEDYLSTRICNNSLHVSENQPCNF